MDFVKTQKLKGRILMDGIEFRQTLLKQIQDYLEEKITKEEYYNTAEPFYTKYANSYINPEFHEVFLSTMADACLIYIDEPGLTPEIKEELFYKTANEAYKRLNLIE